jgi:hypothetical protein
VHIPGLACAGSLGRFVSVPVSRDLLRPAELLTLPSQAMDRRDFFRHTISTGGTAAVVSVGLVAAKRRLWNVDMHDVDQLFEQERV